MITAEKCYREIPPQAVGGGIFDRFSNVDNFRLEVVSAVKSTTVLDFRVNLGDSRSNRSGVIRLVHFVTDERPTTPAHAGHNIKPKRHTGFA